MIRSLFVVLTLVLLVSCSDSSESDAPATENNGTTTNDNTTENNNMAANDARSCAGLTLGFANLAAEDVKPEEATELFAEILSWNIVEGQPVSTPYGVSSYHDAEENQGSRMFTGGEEVLSVAEQTVAVTADLSGCALVFSAEIGGYASQEDNAQVDLTFLGSSGESLSAITLGPVMAADRENVTKLILREKTQSIPELAVQAKLTITMNRVSGTANDGYLDNVSVNLN